MSLPYAWVRLPGPADFLDTILEDLADRVAVIVGLPEEVPATELTVEIADSVRHRGLGRWEAIRSAEARSSPPGDALAARLERGSATDAVLWIDATGVDAAAISWIDHARLLGEFPDLHRICVVVNESCAEVCVEDKRLRRRIWRDFVTALDARALAERFGRRAGHRPAHTQIRGTLVAELAGNDLSLADRLCRDPVGRIMGNRAHSRERIWAAQVQILFPLVERERQRLLNTYKAIWKLTL